MKNSSEEICCNDMLEKLTHKCEMHSEPFDCPDHIVFRNKKFDYGIIIHDGGSSYIKINYCPWCGKRLSKKSKTA